MVDRVQLGRFSGYHARPLSTFTKAVPPPEPHRPPAATAPSSSYYDDAVAAARAASVRTNAPLTKRVFKVIVIGDANVGKTCLSFRFCNGRFPEHTEATIGVDFREKVVTLEGEMIRVQLWDTAGQERFRQSMTAHYYRNVQAIVLVYDVTKPSSFHNLEHWINECKTHAVDFGKTPVILVGNKCDEIRPAPPVAADLKGVPPQQSSDIKGTPPSHDSKMKAVPTTDAQRFADGHNMPLFETSAKADSEADHVDSIFMTLVHRLKESKSLQLQSTEDNSDNNVIRPHLVEENPNGGWCGC